ncbi:MAG: hypothetical protein IPO28_02515 [Holophagaceae bacterium]|nr:hypothetical protein [Holophagaceae bacterium]
MHRFIILLLLTLALPARAQEGLRYRIQLWMRGDEQVMETRFRLQSTAGTRSHNKVQKPRMGGWRLEADRTEGTPYAQAMLLGRAERLLYLAGPSPQTRPEPIALRFGSRSLPVWSLEMPQGLHASTVLVEVAPKLLALCDLSVRFEQGTSPGWNCTWRAWTAPPPWRPPKPGPPCSAPSGPGPRRPGRPSRAR